MTLKTYKHYARLNEFNVVNILKIKKPFGDHNIRGHTATKRQCPIFL